MPRQERKMEDSKNLLYRFRVFDMLCNEYVNTEMQSTYIEPNGDVVLMRLEPSEQYGTVPWFVIASDETDRYAVERCTGLRDTNKTPIYEGDIVKLFSDLEELDVKGVVTYSQYECRYIAQRMVDGQPSYLTVTGADDAPAVPDGWGLTAGGRLTIDGNVHTFK